ncbi:alpha/beta fold hydrolase [Fodinicola acaciae]|uniref:alpha/beta fold hydrolase n=1 Tax=Fodinicola acaciae TaxID=2681555 RepID=UPI0013D7A5AB|nr:alpha/beta hydrolase [Fodinicola acaciae]
MTEIRHRTIDANGLRMAVAEAGEGPLVVLLHGFPESWYSWRHQLVAFAEAGFHAVAPNQRGYPGTDQPADIADYTILHLVGDVVGLIGALGAPDALVVGHDWGSPVAWNTALLRPDLVRGVASLSVPATPRSPVPPLGVMTKRFGERFYQNYFQAPGVAEAELEADLTATFGRLLVGVSGDSPQIRELIVPDGGFAAIWPEPETLPAWLTRDDIATYARDFATTGLRGPLNWYRNIDRNWALTAPWSGVRIAPPALFLAGDRDPVLHWFGAEQVAAIQQLALADLRESRLLAGAGHWLQQERPAEVNAALLAFASNVTAL